MTSCFKDCLLDILGHHESEWLSYHASPGLKHWVAATPCTSLPLLFSKRLSLHFVTYRLVTLITDVVGVRDLS